MCSYVIANPTSPIALADCDNGGISNIVECQNGGDPLNPTDDCDVINSGVVDICDTLAVNPLSPLANVDCDGDGQTNATECANNTDPGDPCSNTYTSAATMCAYVTANPTSPLALADCDNGGISNIIECQNGGDPLSPSDDCNVINSGVVDICDTLAVNPTSPLANVDCDGDGQTNTVECTNNTDPGDPCSNTYTTAQICTYVTANPTSPLALADCDNGGISNIIECQNGGDPLSPSDDCNVINSGVVDICDTLAVNPTSPLANVDCDGDGQTNATECTNNTDPGDPCSNTYTSAQICTYVTANPTSPLALADCDNGGISNIIECQNGGDPLSPSDDCNVINSGVVDICDTLAVNPTSPLANVDCDGDGQTNTVECTNNTDPGDPCSNTYTSAQICTYVTANPTSPLALADCDNGGISNIIECQTGGDPLNAGDDCPTGAGAADTICARIALNPTGGLAMSDCDGDGQTNATECTNNTDPTDACSNTYTSAQICTYVIANPLSPLALADCDNGGIINLIECQNGKDPLTPVDECDLINSGAVNVCVLLALNPSNPLANVDCDGDGQTNATECTNNTDPGDPCSNTYTSAQICTYVIANPTSPLALADCDNGGISNIIECQNGKDPLTPVDECDLVMSGVVNICDTLLINPNNPLASVDCDGDGMTNLEECLESTLPGDPCSVMYTPAELCTYVLANPTSPLALEDCDNGGIINLVECQNGNNPLDPSDECDLVNNGSVDVCALIALNSLNPLANIDCDGDGLMNSTECLIGTDPGDPCSNNYTAAELCAYVTANPTSPLATADCDNGGISNLVECQNGKNPLDPSDECDLINSGVVNVCTMLLANPNNPLANVDCDGDGQSNATECSNGTDPGDECSNNYTSAQLCAYVTGNPTSPLATADCDNGGISNLVECQNGNNPLDPSDECDLINSGVVNICPLLAANPSNPLANVDCDGDGQSNATECSNGTDPGDECSNSYTASQLCAYVILNTLSPLAIADCDNGGISNVVECQNGNNPLDASDECDLINSGAVNICPLLTANPANPLANVDCDGDGLSNATECNAGTDPGDECSYTYTTAAQVCTFVLANPTSPLALADCDLGGVINITECQEGTNPLDPADDAGTLSGNQWKDTNGNGIQDAGEPAVANAEVSIYNCTTGLLVRKDTTDNLGKYSFDKLKPGIDYFVRFTNPDPTNCGFTFQNVGANDAIDSDVNASGIGACTRIDAGEKDDTYDAGLVSFAKVGDYVWEDTNGDGIQGFGENALQGVTVTLYDKLTNTVQRTFITGTNGQYLFDRLMPGQYYVKFTLPTDYRFTTANSGSDVTDSDVDDSNGAGTTATIFLSPSEDDRTWDAGAYRCSMISGDVWYDLNKDGVYQDLENGINGLSVFLIDASTGLKVASAVSGPKPGTPSDDGYYKFQCVKPGRYYVSYDRPGDLAASAAFQGTDRNKDSHLTHAFGPNTSEQVNLTSGTMVTNFNAGFQVKALVGNFVWLDANQNGIQDGGEKPVQGVKVMAMNLNGVVVSESTTGVDGIYNLDGIAAGDYYVKFQAQSQYGYTTPNVGNDDIDSDVNGSQGSGTTPVMRVNTGDRLANVDAGLILSVLPIEWIDFNAHFNGSYTELNWITGKEINNFEYVIERRHESEKNFVEIGKEAASTNLSAARHDYTYDDFDVVANGVYYYRIKQVDRDGSFTYSKVIAVKKVATKDFNVQLYPNPVRDILKVEIELGEDGTLKVEVIDASGKQVMSQPFGGYTKAGKHIYELNTSNLSTGNYIMKIQSPTGVVNQKFAVAK